MKRLLNAALVAAALAVLAGCASFSDDGGFTRVEQLTQQRIPHKPSWPRNADAAAAVQARVAELLQQPLNADSVVQIALLNKPGLQARYAGLGISEADLVRAGRLANPSLSFGRLSGAGGVEIDRAVLFDVLGLLTMPWAQQAERDLFEQTQMQAADATVELAGQARAAFFEAVAAQQLQAVLARASQAAAAAGDLAARLAAAGNFSRLAQLREQALQSDATLQLMRAQQQQQATRERLVRVLALSGAQLRFTLPDELPALPVLAAAPADAAQAEQTAMQQRLDVLIARREAEASARSFGLTKATRFVNVLQAGWQNQSHSSEPLARGYQVVLELPLFDFGSTRVARAQASYEQALMHTAQVALDAGSEVREAYAAYRSAWELARLYRDEVLPLRQQIAEQNLLRYNGMLMSVFELLADKKEQIASISASVQALRDFWLAQNTLQASLVGRAPATPAPATR